MESLSSVKTQSWLVWFVRGFLVLIFLILIARLFELQVIRGDYFRALAEGNRIRRVSISAPRGEIRARGGEVIVGNKEVEIPLPDTGSDEGDEELGAIVEKVRDYNTGEVFGHLTGYVGEVNKEELGKVKGDCTDKGPRGLGEHVGRTGLEFQYECMLSGYAGEELIEVDARGKKIRSLGRRDPIPGATLETTIDYGLQRRVFELMAGKKGAVVISDGEGEILTLFSSPGFDPDLFVNPDKKGSLTSVMKDDNHPLFNRAIGGLFHPGSVYKPIVAAAALSEGKIDKDFHYQDTGAIVIKTLYGTFSYKNWYFTQYGGVEGSVNLERAMARSTDTYFYKIGELTGADKIYEWSKKFGMTEVTGIDLPGEIPGLVPNPEWKLKEKGERWFLGNTYHFSIGQGDLALTPLSVNAAITGVANGGRICKPHIKKDSPECTVIDLSKDSIEAIKAGMKSACSTGGTAYTFFDFKEKSGIEVACKTGTAQNEVGEPHAWFTVFAPADNPQVVATVLIEKGGEGSKVAGPIARDIFNYIFDIKNSPTLTGTPEKQ